MPPKRRYTKAPTIDTSQHTLVIVESPAKAKTIKKYLGWWFEVVASMWHVSDLIKWNKAIDIEKNFLPKYEVVPEKKSVVNALKKAIKQMDRVWLATDEDREWEAIAWHLCQALGLSVEKTPRIVFREITQAAIDNAVAHPRTVDINLVDAQQARRVLDRLVWFQLSPVLWKKIKTWLSAWRVQSVAVKLLVEKEREIQDHTTVSSFQISGVFKTKENHSFTASIKKSLSDKNAVTTLMKSLQTATFHIDAIQQKPSKKNPSPPLSTSWLQQAASTKLWYSVSKTMQLAQRLYEAWHITYMRTDSLYISPQAIGAISWYITKEYGAKYLKTRQFTKKSKWAQEAHECIRPTNFFKPYAWADEQQKKLYHLIWQRTVASQMSPADVLKTTMQILPSTTDIPFLATWEVVTFDGFLKVYDGKWGDDVLLPTVKQGEEVYRDTITAKEQFSKPPARYTEASLVKKLEELGIWRPSTYAPTISTIQQRWYVEAWIDEWTPTDHAVATLVDQKILWTVESKKLLATKGKLVPTSIGIVVTDFLQEHFAEIMDYGFTAAVEEEFDHIAHGSLERQTMIKKFYWPFHTTVEQVTETAERASGERVLWDDPATGKPVSVRIWRYGPLVQIGEQWDEDIKYASLPHGLQLETVTLEQALEAFALPRELWLRQDKQVKASIGRFGPYVQRWSTFASIKQPDDPYHIDYERAVELLEEKVKKDQERILQTFVYNDKEWVVQRARRNHQIKRNRKTIPLAKWVDGATLPYDTIVEILASTTKKSSPRKKSSRTKKTPARKPATKKTSTKRAATKKTGTTKKTTATKNAATKRVVKK